MGWGDSRFVFRSFLSIVAAVETEACALANEWDLLVGWGLLAVVAGWLAPENNWISSPPYVKCSNKRPSKDFMFFSDDTGVVELWLLLILDWGECAVLRLSGVGEAAGYLFFKLLLLEDGLGWCCLSASTLELVYSWCWDWLELLGRRLGTLLPYFALEDVLDCLWIVVEGVLLSKDAGGDVTTELLLFWDFDLECCNCGGCAWAGKFSFLGSRPRTWDELMVPWPCTIFKNCCSSKYFSAAQEGLRNENLFLMELRFSIFTRHKLGLMGSSISAIGNTYAFRYRRVRAYHAMACVEPGVCPLYPA